MRMHYTFVPIDKDGNELAIVHMYGDNYDKVIGYHRVMLYGVTCGMLDERYYKFVKETPVE